MQYCFSAVLMSWVTRINSDLFLLYILAVCFMIIFLLLFESSNSSILTNFSDECIIRKVVFVLNSYLIIVSSAYLSDIALCSNFILFTLHWLSDEVDDNLSTFLNFK